MCHYCHTMGHSPTAPAHRSFRCRNPNNTFSQRASSASSVSSISGNAHPSHSCEYGSNCYRQDAGHRAQCHPPGFVPRPKPLSSRPHLSSSFGAPGGASHSQSRAPAGGSVQQEPTALLDIKDVYFSQSTIKQTFKNGDLVQDLIDDLKSGEVKLSSLPPIRVTMVDGKWVSLDNRRLFAMKEALKGKRASNRNIPVVKVDLNKVADELHRKLTTKHTGAYIHIKDGIPGWVPRKGPKGGWYVFDKDHKKVYVSQLSKKQIQANLQKDPALQVVYEDILQKQKETKLSVSPSSVSSTDCKYGANCYRQGAEHRAQCHPPGFVPRPKPQPAANTSRYSNPQRSRPSSSANSSSNSRRSTGHSTGRHMQDLHERKLSGLRNDGFTPDLRTARGRALAGYSSHPPRHTSSRSNLRAASPWNQFQQSMAGQGYSPSQMSSMYRTQNSAPTLGGSYSSMYNGGSGGRLGWNAFQRSVGGQGYSKAEISRMYHAQTD